MNPFAPSSAPVGHPSARALPRPLAVSRSVALVLASLVLGLAQLLPAVHGLRPGEEAVPLWFTLAMVGVFGGLTVWLAGKMYAGRNWSRWAMLAYLGVGWVFALEGLVDDFSYSSLAGPLNLVGIALEVAAMWLVFQGPGRAWYGALRAQRAASSARRAD